MRVLVTGGTGVLGRQLVDRLLDDADVRVLSRRAIPKPGFVQGDLETGEGVGAAVDGVDVIAHCASSSVDYRHPDRDVAAARRLLDAVRGARPHIVYISIVGIDRISFGYYRAKVATENLIQDSGLPWTILRTTQFHDLILMFAMMVSKMPVAAVPRGLRMQPVDVAEVADRMAALVRNDPAGRVKDFGGPRVESTPDLMRAYLSAAGSRKPMLRLPLPGWGALAGFKAGEHLLGDGERGERTFGEFLRTRLRPDGTIEPPYASR